MMRFAWLLWFYGFLLNATYVAPTDFREMAEKSEVIVRGKVLKQTHTNYDKRAVLITQLLVEEAFKGAQVNDILSVYQIDPKDQYIEGAYAYRPGETLVFFGLRMDEFVVSYGLGIGKWELKWDLGEWAGMEVNPWKEAPLRLPLSQLKKDIHDALRHPATLVNPFTPEGPVSILFQSGSAWNYRYICNGINANGHWEEDICGSCTALSAPRWEGRDLKVHVDNTHYPEFLDQKTWESLVQKAVHSWNGVAGSRLKMQVVFTKAKEDFGHDSQYHEVFWITDLTHWRRMIGAGENGVLGVTKSPYECPRQAGVYRRIYDSDLVLNGTGGVHWSPEFDPLHMPSFTVLSTLTHELGHFLGLGHACAKCDWSVMTAQGGLGVEEVLLYDRQALLSIYAETQKGQMGQFCDTLNPCEEGMSCVNFEGNPLPDYCTKICDSRHSCPEGFGCQGGMCKAKWNHTPVEGGIWDPCNGDFLCQPGLVCAVFYGDKYRCFYPCQKPGDCKGGDTCHYMEETQAGICASVARLEEPCSAVRPCAKGSSCAFLQNGLEGTCYKRCDLPEACESGWTCRSYQGMDLCMPQTTLEEQKKEGFGSGLHCACHLDLLKKDPPWVMLGFILMGWCLCARALRRPTPKI